MGPCRAVPVPLLVLGLALALAGAATPAPDGATTLASGGSVPPSPPGPWAVGYGTWSRRPLELLNARAEPYVLRLREARPRPGWAEDLQPRQELSFTVEETLCRAPGTATAACKSRWLGAVSWCRGVFLEQHQPLVELSCDRVPATDQGAFQGLFQCSKVWIRDRLNLPKPKP
ncbi:LOW QUALITY PROTEIN: cathelicidin-B1-like [Leptosomus discolor]